MMASSFLNESNRIVTSNLHDLFHHATNHQSLYSQNVFLYIIVYDHPPLIGGIKATVSPSFYFLLKHILHLMPMLNSLHLGLGLRLKIPTGVKSFDLTTLTQGHGQIVVDRCLLEGFCRSLLVIMYTPVFKGTITNKPQTRSHPRLNIQGTYERSGTTFGSSTRSSTLTSKFWLRAQLNCRILA